jgi:threonine dehydrogenase-like Zn-dependent dehydrogenase
VPGCQVELIDVNPARATIADALQVGFALPNAAREEADIVIHASGSAEGLTTALRLAAFETTVVEMSWFGTQQVNLPLGEAFHARRLSLRASQVGAVATSQRPRWSHQRRLALAIELLAEPALDCLITGESPFSELPTVLARLASGPGKTISHLITYP